jgi:cytochrome P450
MTSLVKMFNYLLLPFSELLEKLPLPQSRRLGLARRTLDRVIYTIIDERRRSGEDTGDLLSMLLLAQDEESGTAMTDQQVRDEALTLFLAGHETTANALTWTWYLLSQHPRAQAELWSELGSVLGPPPEGGIQSEARWPTFEDIANLKYTEAVLAESMRLFPPAWTVGRLAVADHDFRGFVVPPATLVLASQWVMHRDPRFWDKPEDFRPERWFETSVKDAGQKYIYFPFGGGVRRCIGESFAWSEGILLIAALARSWKLELLPEQKIGLQPMITLRPKYGMRMKLVRR